MDIAVIGMAGRFPLSDSIDEFYKNLRSGKQGVRELSPKRKMDTSIPNLEYQAMGFLEDIDKFDHEFFKISRKEADFMNPQQRLIMEVVYHLVEDAGYSPIDLSASATSVYISNSEFEYQNFSNTVDATSITGNSPSTAAGRISRFFDLRGSSVNVDTGCSSSLVAIHLACREIQTGEADAAIVCGCSINIFPALKRMEVDTGITAPDGRVKAFARDADGTISGEAVVAVMIKPLEQAFRDKDHVYAVIKGSAVNHNGGRASFLTAPSSIGQAEVIRKAWSNASIKDVEEISYIETHGTGTKIGDPIEAEGLRLAFSSYTDAKKFCAISSVKTNVGHTDKAAGLTGFVKAVLAIKNKVQFASLNFDEPNPLIDFETSPLYVSTATSAWKVRDGFNRYAGVSSFGISGTNAHVVLCEAMDPAREKTGLEPMPFLITAKTRQALRRNMKELATFLKENSDVHLPSLSFTLNLGREHHDYRWGTIESNVDDLIVSVENALAANVDESVQRQVTNINCDFEYKDHYHARRISLPGYQFEKIRCWLREPGVIKESQVADWLYTATWVRNEVGKRTLSTRSILIFGNGGPFFDELVNRLKVSNSITTVTLSDRYEEIDRGNFLIDVSDENNYTRLRQALVNSGIEFNTIIHLGGHSPSFDIISPEFNNSLQYGVASQLHLVKVFHNWISKKNSELVFVTSNGQSVLKNENICPSHGLSMALMKSILLEYPYLNVRYIDTTECDSVAAELECESTVRFVSYRNGQRYVQSVDKLLDVARPIQFNDNEAFLVTGGATGIGLEICRSFATRSRGCKIIILGRTNLTEGREDHSQALGRKNAIGILKGLGADVHYFAVDISDDEKMRSTFSQIGSVTNKLTGVVHCAGISGTHSQLKDQSLDDVRNTFEPKVWGSILLNKYCSALSPGFFVFCSSLSSLVPNKNTSGYAMANLFEDLCANAFGSDITRYLSINWPGWSEAGMSIKGKATPQDEGSVKQINNRDGIEAFYLALGSNLRNVIVANTDLDGFSNNPFFEVGDQSPMFTGPSVKTSDDASINEVAGDFVNDIERRVSMIWTEILKQTSFSVSDDFFNVGGHSLNGFQVVQKISSEFNVTMEFEDLLDHGSIGELAKLIEERMNVVKEQ
jgi:3-oxoacyl-(acyl-carrier-protein) synthase/acyl carrier protein